MALLIPTIVLFILYSILIIYYWQRWKSGNDFIVSAQSSAPDLKISVIIPARNEEQNIGALLEALEKQTYPRSLFEVIVVDDHSTDSTAAIVRRFPSVLLLQLKDDGINSYKKKAVETAIAAASGKWIVTTDADCLPLPTWLQTIASYQKETNSVFIAAPVVMDCNSTLLQMFQSLDFLVLQGITAASVHPMSNGANQAYDRNAFYEVNGFTGIDQIASGDDMLLMNKIRNKYPGHTSYLRSKDAIVRTQPMKTWKEFFNQRIRWASKTAKYDDKKIIATLLLVYLFNLSFLALLIAGFWYHDYWFYLAGLWLLKTLVELPFVHAVAVFFGKRSLIKFFSFFQPFHILYTIVAGLFGQFGKYQWKGRNVR